MLEKYSFVGVVFSLFLIILSLYFVKKRKIRGSTFVLWLIIGLVIGIISIVPSLLVLLYSVIGTEVLISSVTAMTFFTLLLLIFYMHYKIDQLNDKVMKLTAMISSLEQNNNLKKKVDNRNEG
jgi:hypothetical protein